MSRIVVIATLIAAVFLSCKPLGKPGEACTVTGDGFSRKDSCADTCVNWTITCGDGSQVVPNVCAGPVCGGGGACPDGFHCLQVDSVPANARCMPADFCPTRRAFTPADPDEDWIEDGDDA